MTDGQLYKANTTRKAIEVYKKMITEFKEVDPNHESFYISFGSETNTKQEAEVTIRPVQKKRDKSESENPFYANTPSPYYQNIAQDALEKIIHNLEDELAKLETLYAKL